MVVKSKDYLPKIYTAIFVLIDDPNRTDLTIVLFYYFWKAICLIKNDFLTCTYAFWIVILFIFKKRKVYPTICCHIVHFTLYTQSDRKKNGTLFVYGSIVSFTNTKIKYLLFLKNRDDIFD